MPLQHKDGKDPHLAEQQAVAGAQGVDCKGHAREEPSGSPRAQLSRVG